MADGDDMADGDNMADGDSVAQGRRIKCSLCTKALKKIQALAGDNPDEVRGDEGPGGWGPSPCGPLTCGGSCRRRWQQH